MTRNDRKRRLIQAILGIQDDTSLDRLEEFMNELRPATDEQMTTEEWTAAVREAFADIEHGDVHPMDEVRRLLESHEGA